MQIKPIIGVVDIAKFGYPVAAVVALDVAHDKLEAAIEALAKEPEVRWVSTTTGRFDIIFITRFHSSAELSDFMTKRLAKVDGVRNSETFVCLDMKKASYIPLT